MQATFKFLLLPVLLLPACKDGDGDTSDGSSSGGSEATDATGDVEARSYWQDVAPIYYDSCVACHQAGGIAPFRLDNPDDAATWAGASAAAVAARTMPPWLMTSDGSCGEFRGSRALSDEDIGIITLSSAAGAVHGEPRDDLKPPPLPGLGDGLTLRTPEFTPSPVGGPLAEFDEYRCFMIGAGQRRIRGVAAALQPNVELQVADDALRHEADQVRVAGQPGIDAVEDLG
jgi:hypothetical protein